MISVPSFKIEYNESTGIYTISSEYEPEISIRCPLCDGCLKYRDSKVRDVKDMFGETRSFSLRRLRCIICQKLHTEIPDIIQPYKHYDSHTIQSVLDDSEDAKMCVADNSTIRRWKADFAKAEPDIEQRLASVYAQQTDEKAPLVFLGMILSAIRATVERWLAFVMKLLINNGHKLCTQFAFCPSLVGSTVKTTSPKERTGGKKNDKTTTDTGRGGD